MAGKPRPVSRNIPVKFFLLEVKTIGDAFLATCDATGRALRCAADILAGAKDIGLHLRAGVHTGEVAARDVHSFRILLPHGG
jgi:class 3 adenylate cyclase